MINMYEFVDTWGNKIYNFVINTFNNLNNYLPNIKNILLIITILYTIMLMISLFKIYDKENYNKYLALIPIYNLYYYFKIIDLPYFLVFIPIINIITLFLAPSLLSHEYGFSRLFSFLSVLFPFILIPYIAFSKHINIHTKKSRTFVHTVHDIDVLEDKLKNNKELINFDPYGNSYEQIKDASKLNKKFKTNIDKKIEKIETNAIQDDLNDLLYGEELKKETPKMSQKELEKLDESNIENLEEDIDTQDQLIEVYDSKDIRKEGIEAFQNKIEANTNIQVENNANYHEYKVAQKSLSSIAFGGTNNSSIISNAKTEAKNIANDLKCPTCGSSIAGSNGVCPGCGHDVSKILFEYNKKTN